MGAIAKDVAEKIVEEIVQDLTNREGLRQQWDRIDPKLAAEIIAGWKKIALDKIMGF